MIRAEYFRFMQTLGDEATPDGIRKIANLVLHNLQHIVPLTYHQGQRAKQIVSMSQATWDTETTKIMSVHETTLEQSTNLKRLKTLSVGPFRGFAREELFDLSKELVLIYGPNGTGKSSFCEALEYSLLGSVAEAESKRFRDQRSYLKNAHIGQYTPPALIAENDGGEEFPVEPNDSLYRFFFVEKTRIDDFSRIAAQTPAKQTELISSLFGLTHFTEFVRNFTPDIDDRYIDLVGAKGLLLAQKRKELAGAEQQITHNTIELTGVAEAETTTANQYKEGTTFALMVDELHGDEQTPGAIKRLESELQQPVARVSGVSRNALDALCASITAIVNDLNAKREELSIASQQLSYRQLYEAVSQLQPLSPDHCPACKTPLIQVAVNPYTYASEELQALKHLAVLQQTARQLEQSVQQALFSFQQIIITCVRHYPENNMLHTFQVANAGLLTTSWWHSIFQKLSDGYTPWQHLVVQVKQLEDADRAKELAVQQQANKKAELDRLRAFSQQITVLQTRRQTAERAISDARHALSHFDTENSQLIADVEAEKAVILKNSEIASSYAEFVQRLNDYSNNLPAKLVADLGEGIVTLYNAFNRNDAPGELLSSVKLPLVQNQRLEIAFQNDPVKFFDALHVLSEGHIRCIGLALLLAKNRKENCPLLIFDDPVNAIDDDHREAIRRTIFEDSYLSGKQIILTCHGEEFFKDIQNLLPVSTVRDSRLLTFLPRLDETHIRVDFNCSPRNYIIAAREHLNRNETRESLAKSRQALESLAKGKVWKYVNKYGDGNLSLKLRSPSSPIELRNLAEQLKSKISSGDFGDQNKSVVFTPLEALLGKNGESREWRYLNKGTHEESNHVEFDRQAALSIVSALEQLDAVLS